MNVSALLLILLFAVSICATLATQSHKNPSHPAPTIDKYSIVEEKVVYSRWRTVTQRKVRYPKGNIVDFDVSEGVLALNMSYVTFAYYM